MKRSYLNDTRAYAIYKAWLRSDQFIPDDGEGYSHTERFRGWTSHVAGRFFNILEVWPDWAVVACCVRLGVPCPPLVILESYSEDEAIRCS